MTEEQYRQRRAVLACLQQNPKSPDLSCLTEPRVDGCQVLNWLDDSGLALYLLDRLRALNLTSALNLCFVNALEARLESNRCRTASMLQEFARVNTTLQSIPITYAVMKGFALPSEFCPEPWLRHQCDIDLLVTPGSVRDVQEALEGLGYKVESADPSGEICLAIRSGHVPSSTDYLYEPPKNRHVEIHSEFHESVSGVTLQVGQEWSENIEWAEIEGVRFPRLQLPYRLLGQILHVFRHTSSWVRLSWLYEIAYFLEQFHDNSELWVKVDQLTRHSRKVQNACGVVCKMVGEVFGTAFPDVIEESWIKPLPFRQMAWVRRHGSRWVLQEFTTSEKLGFLLQRDFADSKWSWWQFRFRRYAKFLKSILRRSEYSHSLFLRERIRKHINYLWHCLRWKVDPWLTLRTKINSPE